MGHADVASVMDFFIEAHNLFTIRGARRAGRVEDFEDALFDSRFEAGSHLVARQVFDAGLGFPHEDAPDLSTEKTYHVLKLRYLYGLIDSASALKSEVTLPMDMEPRDEDGFRDDWESLAEDERQFTLAGFLGSPVIWFTDQGGADCAERYAALSGMTRADAYSEVLGLGHVLKGQWLVRLEIPGWVVQAAGHYRPLFCDAIKHRWFMARSSGAAPPPPWGQTANLRELTRGMANYDGSRERVARQIDPHHVPDAVIRVDLLGKVARPDHFQCAPPTLVQGVWARRRAR